MSSLIITEADLAELYAIALPSGAAIHQERAAEEQVEEIEVLEDASTVLDLVSKFLGKVPDPKGDKHTETCWERHAPCLAQRLVNLIENGQ